jgi:PAS fold
MVGKTLFDPLPPEAREHVRAQFERALTGEPIHFETVFVDGEGRLRGVRAQHLTLRDGD